MAQITTKTNPTGLKRIDKKHFVIRLGSDSFKSKVFWLESFDFLAAGIEPFVQIGCIAHAGNTEEYFELGRVDGFEKGPFSIKSLASDRPLRFRFIFNRPNESLLVGFADGIQAFDEAEGFGASLVDIEPLHLHGPLWKLVLPDGGSSGEKPTVLVEMSVFPNASSAVKHPWFSSLVMPEVMRQIAFAIARECSALDDSEHWISSWRDYILNLGMDVQLEKLEEDFLAQTDWADSVVSKFVEQSSFKNSIRKAVAELEGEI
ncbi:hypothetical protein [Pseudomonas monteilii]|uniref:hypothetical protein n=1 Tax=Pseudomonas monteilii TaxID=76759 RepID=UPI00383BEA01